MRELISNPAFKDYMSYVPKMVYEDSEGKTRIYDEMWTEDWWWKIQVREAPNLNELRVQVVTYPGPSP